MSELNVMAHVEEHLPGYINQLVELVKIPSVSAGAEGDPRPDIDLACNFLTSEFNRIGLVARKIALADGIFPLVVAHSAPRREERPTVLFYGHYDVQGVDNPRNAWEVDPFIGHRRAGYLIGRGASDNKGPLFAHIKAIDAMLATQAELPLNVVFIIEGEEECGSRTIARFLTTGGLDDFGPIACTVISDTSMFGPGQPSLCLGLRGIVYTEMAVRGPHQDLHSGLFGGTIHNPNHLLAKALANLVGDDQRVNIPGFYDEVMSLSDAELERYSNLPVDEEAYRTTLGVDELIGEPGYSLLERRWTRPTLDINYISGGSPRTIIPAVARGALSCRLVPAQNPDTIRELLEEAICRHLPERTKIEFSNHHLSPAYSIDLDNPLVKPALSAIHTGFGIQPVLTREGGSIPIVADIARHTQAPVLLIGFGQITDNWHGPNERFLLEDFRRGIRTSVALLHRLARD